MMSWLSQYVDHPWLFFGTTLFAAFCLVPFFRWFFGDTRGLADDAAHASLPDWIALLMGRFWRGEWAEVKLLYFAILTVAAIASFYKVGVMLFC